MIRVCGSNGSLRLPRLVADVLIERSRIPLKSKATSELIKDFGLTPEGWLRFRNKLLETVPALNALEPRYNSKVHLDGYINGPGFLSYHESEITLATLEALLDRGICSVWIMWVIC